MTLYFISDLHIRDDQSEIAQRFVSFLSGRVQAKDTLVLGGDLFDLFIGSKTVFVRRYPQVLQAIKNVAAQGTSVVYFEGNHDFFVQKTFAQDRNVRIEENEATVRWKGGSLYVAHGDMIDEEDRGYRFLRYFIRSWLGRTIIKFLPGTILLMVGEWSSKKSRHYNDADTAGQPVINRTKSLFHDYAMEHLNRNHDVVFLGHSHIQDEVRVGQGEQERTYINLGYSADSLRVACWQQGEGFPKIESVKTQ